MLWRLALCGLVLIAEYGARSQTAQTLSVPADSPRWELEGEAKAAEYQGRKCLLLHGGGATLKDFVMRDGVVDVDVDVWGTSMFCLLLEGSALGYRAPPQACLRSVLPRATHESGGLAGNYVEGSGKVAGAGLWRVQAREVAEYLLLTARG
jgi:hypothetical protein